MTKIKNLLIDLFAREPDFIVGGKDDPYMLRWWIIPRNPLFNIYLHKFMRDDEDRALHDHPWVSLSLVIKGAYIEHLSGGRKRFCGQWSLIPRWAKHRHRIELLKDYYFKGRTGSSAIEPKTMYATKGRPAWTIFITGPVVRRWGFWCEGWRFVPWREFTAKDDKGQTGKGCGQ